MYRKQQENFDRVLKCVTHLIYLLVATAKTDDEKKIVCILSILCFVHREYSIECVRNQFQVNENVKKLVRNQIRSACTNDTLLHLCVSRLNVIKSGYFNDGTPVGVSIHRS